MWQKVPDWFSRRGHVRHQAVVTQAGEHMPAGIPGLAEIAEDVTVAIADADPQGIDGRWPNVGQCLEPDIGFVAAFNPLGPGLTALRTTLLGPNGEFKIG